MADDTIDQHGHRGLQPAADNAKRAVEFPYIVCLLDKLPAAMPDNDRSTSESEPGWTLDDPQISHGGERLLVALYPESGSRLLRDRHLPYRYRPLWNFKPNS